MDWSENKAAASDADAHCHAMPCRASPHERQPWRRALQRRVDDGFVHHNGDEERGRQRLGRPQPPSAHAVEIRVAQEELVNGPVQRRENSEKEVLAHQSS